MNDMTNTIKKVSKNTDNAPKNPLSTQTVAFSHYNYISAQLPINTTTDALVSNSLKVQATQCLKNIKSIIESIGHVMNDVIKINIYLKDNTDSDIEEDIKAIDTVYASFFQGYLPTRTIIAVAALPMEEALVQMDAVISNAEGTHPQATDEMVKIKNSTDNAPKTSVSPQIIAFSHYNNISAQLPINSTTGELVAGGIKEQTKQCLENIKAILEEIDVPLEEVVKVNISLQDISDIEAVDEVYSSFFPKTAHRNYVPARTIVVASDLPKHALVQIDAVVSHSAGTAPEVDEKGYDIVIEANNTDDAPKSPLSTQTVAYSDYNHLSAQLPIDPKTGEVIKGGITEQAEQCLENIKTIIESIDHEMDDIVKVTIQLKDISDIDTVNEVYKRYFHSDLPARTVIGVAAIPMDALIQIEAVVSNAEGTPPE
ncbi:RidA family protein [uncultured Psychrobacter sp.]|uniref:RidA family protein n=1 Tax=uncultured Psychrobacter sp. TaxID=259303 RepID=UPI003459990F